MRACNGGDYFLIHPSGQGAAMNINHRARSVLGGGGEVSTWEWYYSAGITIPPWWPEVVLPFRNRTVVCRVDIELSVHSIEFDIFVSQGNHDYRCLFAKIFSAGKLNYFRQISSRAIVEYLKQYRHSRMSYYLFPTSAEAAKRILKKDEC